MDRSKETEDYFKKQPTILLKKININDKHWKLINKWLGPFFCGYRSRWPSKNQGGAPWIIPSYNSRGQRPVDS